jgi:hypothetical protein
MSGSESRVDCELCHLPHRPTAPTCERCGHKLGTPPDWTALRNELKARKKRVVLGTLVILIMLALNWFILGGAGGILWTAPIGWILFGSYRYRLLNSRLGRRADESPRSV